jgi:copper chaperone CopZ
MAEVEFDPAKCDVGDLAKAAADAETPHRAQGAPSATLVLTAATGADEKKVQQALQKVKGVDAKKSSVKRGEIHVKLDDKGGAKLADIKEALKDQVKS